MVNKVDCMECGSANNFYLYNIVRHFFKCKSKILSLLGYDNATAEMRSVIWESFLAVCICWKLC